MNKRTYAYIALVTVGGTWILGSSLRSLHLIYRVTIDQLDRRRIPSQG